MNASIDHGITTSQPTSRSTAAAAVIDYILDESTEERLKDLFDFYDADGNGMIQRTELIDVLSLCAHEIGLEVDAYLEQIADAVFSNANLTQCGSITFEGLKEVLKRRPNLINELSLAKCNFQHHTTNTRRMQSSACPDLIYYLGSTYDAIVAFLSQRMPIFNKLRWEYITNNLQRFNFFVAVFLISLCLFVGRIVTYWDSGCGFYILARASGQCLNFFSAIIVLLVCRRSISQLRSRGYGRYLPLDDHVYFHKMMGIFIAAHSLSHTFGHIFNFLVVSNRPEAQFSWAQYLFTTTPGIGWLGHCASLTGWALFVIILIMALAEPFSRRVGKFELFYYTHLLYIPYWAILFIHAPRFWMWFLVPFVIFMVETLLRLRNLLTNLTSSGQTTIIRAVPLPSNVIHLIIRRPANFEYNPGDWIYVLIPQIAKYEWHPFTISSAPEQEGVIWLHIRAVGEWTRSLRAYFEGIEHRNHLSKFIKCGQFSMSMDQFNMSTTIDLSEHDSTQILGSAKTRLIKRFNPCRALEPIPENLAADSLPPISSKASVETFQTCASTASMIDSSSPSSSSSQSSPSSPPSKSPKVRFQTSRAPALKDTRDRIMPNITIFIDGPYGSPSSQIFRAEHAVLIATGIGVTPFASILQSIVHHYEKRRQKCPNCTHEFTDNRPPIVCKLRKVDFVWINRDQKSFEWFIKLLAELELTQSQLPAHERFLDIHIHLTAMAPAQTKSIGLQLALYLVHEKNKKDLVTGLRTRTKAGRPNWDEFFTRIQDQKRGKVSVFFCGSPQLGRLLHRQCDSFGFKFRKEIF